MVRYQNFKNIAVDGHYFIEGFLGLDWLPSSTAKKNAADYEYQVGKVLSEIAAYNWAGLAAIWTIADARREIHIVPDRKWEEDRKEHPQTSGNSDRILLEFSPASAASVGCHNGQRAARRADETLLHELIHGMRMARGKWRSGRFNSDSLRLYGNEEEFLAILLTNIYMSEKRRSPLRGQWITTPEDCDVLQGTPATSDGFLKDDLRLQIVANLNESEGPLFRNVKNAKAAFNPVAEYLANKSAYDERLKSSNPFMN